MDLRTFFFNFQAQHCQVATQLEANGDNGLHGAKCQSKDSVGFGCWDFGALRFG